MSLVQSVTYVPVRSWKDGHAYEVEIADYHSSGRRLPRRRPPTHPGEMLLEEFVVPLGLTQTELAAALGVSHPRLNEIVNRRRSVTPDTALRLARVVGMSADFWLGLQQDWDLWHAMQGPGADEILKLKPLDGKPRDAA